MPDPAFSRGIMTGLSSGLITGIERMKKGLAGIPDCVPVSAQICHHSAKLAGESTYDFFTNAEVFLRSQIYADEFYGFDGLTIHYDTYNIEAEAIGADLVWNRDQLPEADPSKHLLAAPDDFNRIKPVRIGKSGRMPYVLEINDRLMDLGAGPKIRFCGIVSLAAKLLGFDNLMIAMALNPESVHRLFSFLVDEVLAPWIVCQRERSGTNTAAVCSEAAVSPPLLSVSLIREFCLRYIIRLEKMVGNIRLSGIFGEQFLDNPEELLDIKREGSPGCIQGLDPDVSVLGPVFFKRYADRYDIPLIMGIDTNLIQDGPAWKIAERVNRFIDLAGYEGWFCIYINYIPYNTAPEHVHAAVSAAHGYRYNI